MTLALEGYGEMVEVGAGGFGVVYRARELDFDRTVAIKVLRVGLDDRSRARFERERRTMGRLSGHPNIVTIHHAGLTDDRQPFLIMEYLAAGSLADRLEEQGPLPWREAAQIGLTLAGALEAAHRAGVLHRDIKPENVLISDFGEPKLGDFGIAQAQDLTKTHTGSVTATVAHAAPEALAGQAATEASDVYSLASTLYTLLAGAPAFMRDSDESVLPVFARVATEPVPDLRPRGVPDVLCGVLEAAMAKDPAERISTAAEFAHRLRNAITAPESGETIDLDHTTPPPPPHPKPVPPAPAAPAPAARPETKKDPSRRPPPQPRSPTKAPIRPRRRRVIVAVALAAALAVAFGAAGWYARGGYFVDIDSARVTVFKGKPGGLLGWDPTIEERTPIKVGDLTEAERNDIEGGKRFSSRDKADAFIEQLDQKVEDREVTATTTTTTTTTVPPPPPPPA